MTAEIIIFPWAVQEAAADPLTIPPRPVEIADAATTAAEIAALKWRVRLAETLYDLSDAVKAISEGRLVDALAFVETARAALAEIVGEAQAAPASHGEG